ncbi:MAG: type II toxin-antitoxin system Phd/YefM family antitoxin [Planctomycetota bacterium]|jgi:antitoxin (DNA-binding transcriptional repressor) of toxin-antitoxin stability system
MKIVGIRELKDRLSEYIRRVREGGTVLVSSRGHVVAEIRSSYGPRARADVSDEVADLAERGILQLGAANDPSLYPVLDPLLPEGSAEALLDEERGES